MMPLKQGSRGLLGIRGVQGAVKKDRVINSSATY